MNYSNHNLRTDLQEWKNRLYKAPFGQFGHQLKYFLVNLSTNKQLAGILQEISISNQYDIDSLDKILEQISRGADMSFESLEEQAAFCFQFLNYFLKTHKTD